MIFCLILFNLFVSTLQVSNDAIAALAAINAEGYPDSIIYETVSKTLHKSVTQRSKEELVEALMSPEVEEQLRIAAMKYAKSKLGPSLQRQLIEGDDVSLRARDGNKASGCSFSWWSWLPWTDCPAEKNDDAIDLEPQETYAKCFK